MKVLFRSIKENFGKLFIAASIIALAIGSGNASWENATGAIFMAICLTIVVYMFDLSESIERGDMYICLITAWLVTGVMIGKCLP